MIKAIKKRCIIERIEAEKVTAGGIVLQHSQEYNPRAKILSVGEQVTEVKVGDVIVLDWRNTVPLKYNDQTYFVTEEGNIWAVEEQ
jgi:co-chaperonin GroES (HSP10)